MFLTCSASLFILLHLIYNEAYSLDEELLPFWEPDYVNQVQSDTRRAIERSTNDKVHDKLSISDHRGNPTRATPAFKVKSKRRSKMHQSKGLGVVSRKPKLELLPFWEPDVNQVQSDTRRAIERRTNDKVHDKPRNSDHWGNPTRVTPAFEVKSKRRSKMHQTNGLDVSPKPKLRKGKRQGPDDHKSTRLVGVEKQMSKQTTVADDSAQLSPYSIALQLEELTSTFPDANVSTVVLGRTVEYNDIVLLKVTEKISDRNKYFRADDSKYVDETPEKKVIFIVHALSVMGVASLDCLTYSQHYVKLLSYYFAHLDKFDIFLIPMANPDGYARVTSFLESNLWNKNMSPQSECAGVALDRNFDVRWNVSQPISSCSQRYPGPSPFSEPETRAVRDVLQRFSHKIVAYIHLHAGSHSSFVFKGDAILYPKGYSDTVSDDDKYIDLKGELDEAMKNASFKSLSVTVDTLYNWYGRVFGTSVDYASTVYGIPYTMEMVMQLYDSEVSNPEESNQKIALEEVWARVINVVFSSIWKNLHANDV